MPSWQNRFAKSFWRFLNEWQDVIKWDFHLYFTKDLSSKIEVLKLLFRVGPITKNSMVCKHFIIMNHPGPTILSWKKLIKIQVMNKTESLSYCVGWSLLSKRHILKLFNNKNHPNNIKYHFKKYGAMIMQLVNNTRVGPIFKMLANHR